MNEENLLLLNNGIEKLRSVVKDSVELISRLENEKKEAEREKLKKEIRRNPNGVVDAFYESINDIMEQMEREMLRSPFYAKIRLSDEEDNGRKGRKESDMVNHPSHYQGKIECIDAMEKEFGKTAVEWFCLLNAFKYEYRKGNKTGKNNGAVQDIKKRNWYITKFNELRASQKKSLVSSDDLVKLVEKYK